MVTEGAVNALAVERAFARERAFPWPENREEGVAALSGSNLNPLQAAKISSWAKVVVVSDPDAAGDRVADDLAAVFSRHSHVVRARLPRGLDAAEAGPDRVRRAVEEACR